MYYGRDHKKDYMSKTEEKESKHNKSKEHSGKQSDSRRGGTSGYVESDAVKNFRDQLESHAGLKPGDYTSQWQPQIDAFANDIINRKDFQYDVNADALYNQYKDRYVNLGQLAMMDTMGQAAQLTGGYGNSYAQMAGQQAYQGYLQGLTDKIPELAQLAYDRYNQQGHDLYQKYGLLNTQEQNAYNNWLNNYNQWLSERDYITGRYDTERGYDYGVYRDAVADAQWQKQFEEDMRRWNLQWEAQNASGGGGGGGGGGTDYYKLTATALSNSNGSAGEKFGIVAGSPLSTSQKLDLYDKYVAPTVKQEVAKQDPKKDTAAYAQK